MAGQPPKNDETFDNREFWNNRYSTNMTLGSGVGSRGTNLLHKQSLISRYLNDVGPASILDVGCGDFEVLSGLDISAQYIGLDIAPVIVERNRQIYPGKRFECIDFASLANVEDYRADVVLCCEVLIHQHTYEVYRKLLGNIVQAAQIGGFLSGYVRTPWPEIPSPIISWHEPLTETLEDVGARNVEIRGPSLENDRMYFVSFER